MNADRTRRRQFVFAGTLTLLLIAALLLPPLINISRYQRQIAASLSASLGRPVELSAAHLQLLPRPALQISDFAVDAAPGFGAEPILQCSSVTAALRLSSLWRGQLEIARISLDEPSLNLARAASGEWNFETLLVQASRLRQAPTAGQHTGGQHRFPYIEASNARINFKQQDEKLPFSFLNAEVSVWLEQPDQWQLRFVAQPARTDIHLSLADTGLIRMSGKVERAASAEDLPVDLQLQWRGVPLGQLTRMLMAQDMGWRGDTSMTIHITGTPAALRLDVRATASDFHRADYQPGQPLSLAVQCTGLYRHVVGSFDDIDCHTPVGNGSLLLSGSWHSMHSTQPIPALGLKVNHVPASAALAVLRHAGGRLGPDVSLNGWIDGEVAYGPRSPAVPVKPASRAVSRARMSPPSALPYGLTGRLRASGLVLRQGDLTQPLPDLFFAVQPALLSAGPLMLLEPVRLELGAPQPLIADGRLSSDGFVLHASGSGRLRQLLPLATTLAVLPAPMHVLAPEGTADYNLTFEGSWAPAIPDSTARPTSVSVTDTSTAAGQTGAPTTVSGTVALHATSFQPGYLPQPLHIAAATAAIGPAEVRWSGVDASLGEQHFSGSFHMALPCAADCIRHFDLTAVVMDLGQLASVLRGDELGVMHELLSRVQGPASGWPALEGNVHVGSLTVGRIELSDVAAHLALAAGRLEVRAMDGRTLGGALHLTGEANLQQASTYYTQLRLTQISATELSRLLGEDWGPGTLDISGDLKLRGTTARDLSKSAAGTLTWQWSGGALPELTTTPLSHFDRWSGEGSVTEGSLTLAASSVLSDGVELPVSGTIARDRTLDLIIGNAGEVSVATAAAGPNARSTITGTLAAPVVETR